MANRNCQSGLVGQSLEGHFPQSRSAAVTATLIGHNQQLPRVRIRFRLLTRSGGTAFPSSSRTALCSVVRLNPVERFFRNLTDKCARRGARDILEKVKRTWSALRTRSNLAKVSRCTT